MRTISQRMLDQVTALAMTNLRWRKNHNFHASDTAVCHRLLNAIEPGSYIQPHRHLDPDKDETMIILRGKLGVLFFSAAGEVLEQVVLEPGGRNVGVDIPHGEFHTVLGLERGTVFFEAKAGPYLPIAPEEKAGWAPAEGDAGAAAYAASLAAMFSEDISGCRIK